MKRALLAGLLASSAAGLAAQTAPASAAKPVAHASAPAASGIKLPPGIPPARGVLRTAFSLKYQELKIGPGAVAEPNKVYKVRYTVWLAADGRKLDSSDDHPATPVFDDTGKPELGPDGKPKQEAGQPYRFIQGAGRVIPGWDQGFEGIRIGGKRRLFIPYQLAYGTRGRPTNDPKNPGVPPKADLIFDVELLSVTELPAPPPHVPVGANPGGRPVPGGPNPGVVTGVLHGPAASGQPAPGQPAPGQSGSPATPTSPAAPASGAPATAPAGAPATAPATAPANPPAGSAPATPATTPQPK